MDAATLQARINSGLGKAAARLGLTYSVYRSSSMVNPIAPANLIASNIKAAFTPSSTYSFTDYNKPAIPDWTGIVDASTLLVGDWLVGSSIFYLADIQPLLPLPFVQCNRTIGIKRAGYTTSGSLEPTQTVIAAGLPVFMFTQRDKESFPAAFPASSSSSTGTPNWQFYINARSVSAIQKNDVITDENGINYVVDVANLTSFGYIALAHNEKP